MNLARFGLFIDPAPAQAGAKKIIAAVQGIKPSLTDASKAADAAGKAQETLGKSGQQAGGKVATGMRQAADATRRAGGEADKTKSQFEKLVGTVAKLAATLALVYAAFKSLTTAVGFLWTSIGKAEQMEGFRTRWAYMLNSFDQAKTKMADLQQFANTTPFDLPGVTQASLSLTKLKDTGLETMKGLRLVGDAAAIAQQPIEEVASRIARLTNNLKRGGGGGDEVRILGEWQIFSPELVARIQEMGQEAGNFRTLLGEIKKELGSAGGAMDLMATTWNGRMSTLEDSWNSLKTAIGEPIMTALKPLLTDITALFDEMTLAVKEMAPEIEAMVAKIPAAFRVLRSDGGLKLALTAAWDYFTDLMARTWVATSKTIDSIFARAAYNFVEALRVLGQASFWEGMGKAIQSALKNAVSSIFPMLKELDDALAKQMGRAPAEDPVAEANAKYQAEVIAWEKRVADLNRMREERQINAVRNPAFAELTGPVDDLPANPEKPKEPSFMAGLLGETPPPVVPLELPPAEETPAMREFNRQMDEASKALADRAKSEQEMADTLLRNKQFQQDANAQGRDLAAVHWEDIQNMARMGPEYYRQSAGTEPTLFPQRAEIVRNDDVQKEALLPGSDMAYKDADNAAEDIRQQMMTEQEAHAKKLEDIAALGAAHKLTEAEVQKAQAKTTEAYLAAVEKKKEADRAAADQNKTGLQKMGEDWMNLSKQIDGTTVQIFQAIEQNITGALMAMIDGTKSASEAFGDMAKGIMNSIIQMILKLVIQYALMSAMGMAAGIAVPSFGQMSVNSLGGGSTGAAVAHDGGTVGGMGNSRNVPSSVFAGAQRYHSGGMVLGANEVPIIAEKGETVMTKEETANIKSRLSGNDPGKAKERPIQIVNVQDPSDVRNYLQQNEDIVMNIIARNGPKMRQIMGTS